MIAKLLIFTFVVVSLARPDEPSYGHQQEHQQQEHHQQEHHQQEHQQQEHHQQEHQQQEEGPAKYDFDWSVDDAESGNSYGQQEVRDGDNTKGSYYVLLPDGRTQKVTYSVTGDSGFVADVTYEGEAKFEETQSYKAQPQPQPQSY